MMHRTPITAITAVVALGLLGLALRPAAATPPSNLTSTVVALGATATPVSVHSNGITSMIRQGGRGATVTVTLVVWVLPARSAAVASTV